MSKNREYKSDVFSMLMEDKKNALEVYNALNESHYSDPELVEMVKLEKGVSLSIRNDASFIIDMNINFYEHQSTYNPNMPLRSMIYYVNSLEDWIIKNEKDLFGSGRIQIPTPHFVVFYNGVGKRPEYEEMRLSCAFYHSVEEPDIEVKCHVYNINPDNNRKLKENAKVLYEYTYFVEKVREYQEEGLETEEAVETAVEYCIKEHVLEDFFRKRKEEVLKVVELDFTWERREVLIRKEERKIGIEQGRTEERLEKIKKMISKGYSKSQIIDLDYTEQEYEEALKGTAE